MSDLQELISRVESATGPDADISCAVHDLFFPAWVDPRTEETVPPRDYASSLDAVVALAERVRPGTAFAVGNDAEGIHRNNPHHHAGWARVFPRGEQQLGSGNRHGATPALALLLALLHACDLSNG